MRSQEVFDVLGSPNAELRLAAGSSWKGISAVWRECPLSGEGGLGDSSVENSQLALLALTFVVDLRQVMESGRAGSPEVLKS